MSEAEYNLDDVESANEQPDVNGDDTDAGISMPSGGVAFGLSRMQLLVIAAVVVFAALVYYRTQARETVHNAAEEADNYIDREQVEEQLDGHHDGEEPAPDIPSGGGPKEQDEAAYDYLVETGAMAGDQGGEAS